MVARGLSNRTADFILIVLDFQGKNANRPPNNLPVWFYQMLAGMCFGPTILKLGSLSY